MIFSGLYFDGKSSTGHPATLQLQSFGLQITYRGGSESKTLNWDPQQIHSNDLADTGIVYLKYGEFPFQYLEVSEPGFAKALKETYPNARFHKSAYNWIFSTGFAGIIALGILFLGILALAYFVVLPSAAERIAEMVPISWEKQLGDAAYSKMVEANDVDEENTNRMNSFFKELNFPSQYNIDIVIVKDNVINAFALPGGKIIVYEGILRTMGDYTELSALLAHEFSHVELKHATKNIFRSLSSYLLISVLFGDASGVTAVVLENANQFKQLSYSRELEHAADVNGIKLMKQKHINPVGMKQLFESLKKEEGDTPDFTKFLSTHPLTQERIAYVKSECRKKDYKTLENQPLDSLFREIKSNLNE